MTLKRVGLRILSGLGLVLLLGGPTPGAVGSCGEESAPFVDLNEYCETREALSCERRRLRGEFPSTSEQDPEFKECVRVAYQDLCPLRFWAPGCRPTTRQVSACLGALRSFDTLDVEEDDLPECKVSALCTVQMEASDGGMP